MALAAQSLIASITTESMPSSAYLVPVVESPPADPRGEQAEPSSRTRSGFPEMLMVLCDEMEADLRELPAADAVALDPRQLGAHGRGGVLDMSADTPSEVRRPAEVGDGEPLGDRVDHLVANERGRRGSPANESSVDPDWPVLEVEQVRRRKQFRAVVEPRRGDVVDHVPAELLADQDATLREKAADPVDGRRAGACDAAT